MNCPNCQAQTTLETLAGHLGTTVSVDWCAGCQMFWFDTRENLQLTPGAVLRLFRIIGEGAANASRPRPAMTAKPACPRCGVRLLLTHDRQRNTPFQYMRCPNGHGRLVTVFDFLREKDFIRPLSAAQIDELRQNVQSVNCSNCGASIDLTKGTACGHCGTPLSMLDMNRAGALVAELRAADQPKAIDPTLPLRLERARREVDAAFASSSRAAEATSSGLVGAGLRALLTLLGD